MTRILAVAAILAATVLGVQADPLTDQVHAAAVKACAVDQVQSRPVFFYGQLNQACIDRTTSTTLRKIADRARAKTLASTASAN